jgi:hypothetical protein
MKGTKILVLPKHHATAKKTFKEFRQLSKRTDLFDMDIDSMDNDATTVKTNIKGNAKS